MADELSRLQILATCEQIRDYVRVVCVEDDFDEFEETYPSESDVIWPQDEDGQVVAEALGVGLLKSMLAAKQLHTAELLARSILDEADLAFKASSVRKDDSPITTIIIAELSPEHQGRGTGVSISRKADLCLTLNLNSYWADQILFHAPALKELSLKFWKPSDMRATTPLIYGNRPLPQLEKLELSSANVSIESIMAILRNSEQSLTGISFCLLSLVNKSTWSELLTRITNDFPCLTWFKFRNISEYDGRFAKVTFPGLGNDSVIGEPYRSGLELVQRGPTGNRRIPGVEYGGPDANHVLRIVTGRLVAAFGH
ncbi:hypothetical protein ACMFMG_006933 [Clarireedia jacksonii]